MRSTPSPTKHAALRVPLEHLGTRVYPDMFSLARAHEAFTEDGQLAQPGLQQRLADTVSAFVHFVEADVRYVCLQRCWYEFPAIYGGAGHPSGRRLSAWRFQGPLPCSPLIVRAFARPTLRRFPPALSKHHETHPTKTMRSAGEPAADLLDTELSTYQDSPRAATVSLRSCRRCLRTEHRRQEGIRDPTQASWQSGGAMDR